MRWHKTEGCHKNFECKEETCFKEIHRRPKSLLYLFKTQLPLFTIKRFSSHYTKMAYRLNFHLAKILTQHENFIKTLPLSLFQCYLLLINKQTTLAISHDNECFINFHNFIRCFCLLIIIIMHYRRLLIILIVIKARSVIHSTIEQEVLQKLYARITKNVFSYYVQQIPFLLRLNDSIALNSKLYVCGTLDVLISSTLLVFEIISA